MAFVIPGDKLAIVKGISNGPGTHLYDGHICASIAGRVTKTSDTLSVIYDPSPRGMDVIVAPSISALPTVHATVLARVTRINPRQANVAILVIGEGDSACVCQDEFQGLIRQQDIRATEKDKVTVAESFRPGDIVRAVVISLGDQSNYYLETSRNHLGVVLATSEAENAMYPVSWKEFADPVTGLTEARKVAKPF